MWVPPEYLLFPHPWDQGHEGTGQYEELVKTITSSRHLCILKERSLAKSSGGSLQWANVFSHQQSPHAVAGLAHDGKSLHHLPCKPGEDLPQTWALSVVLDGLRCGGFLVRKARGQGSHGPLHMFS